jgi:hypothetical protein
MSSAALVNLLTSAVAVHPAAVPSVSASSVWTEPDIIEFRALLGASDAAELEGYAEGFSLTGRSWAGYLVELRVVEGRDTLLSSRMMDM